MFKILFVFFASLIMNSIMLRAITGGAAIDLKIGGLSLNPVEDSPVEWKKNGAEFEIKSASNGEPYSSRQAVPGFVQQECTMTSAEYDEYQKLQDGDSRSGNCTLPDGSVLSIDGAIDGEQTLVDGKITVKITGKVRKQ